jgi:lipopolysaccharide/colanic/teichoic acid biosynthesis glycosyltransferase
MFQVRRFQALLIDLALIASASVAAFVIRDNFIPTAARFWTSLPYVALTLAAAIVIIPLFRLNRSVWRFSSLVDYLFVVGASATIVFAAVMLSFAINRLDGVPRSVPVIQVLLITALLVGARVFMRLRHANRPARIKQFATATEPLDLAQPSIVIVGLNRLAELYLQSAEELNPGRLRVAGLVGHDGRHTGRLLHRHPVLGVPDDLPKIVQDLTVHGVVVDRIVVTVRWSSLSPTAQAALREMEAAASIRVEVLGQSLGFESGGSRTASPAADPFEGLLPRAPSALSVGTDGDALKALAIEPQEREALKRRRYWTVKRVLDVVGSLGLIVLLAPVMALVALLVLIDVGQPLWFWQQRPGLGGRPFRIYKLRTMGAAHDEEGRLVPDEDRVSGIGHFLRRSRLDELPQLFHILMGQMSFVGPRPLLPIDQPVGFAARLLVRPGLTGWAQVKGGRQISALDKAALDVWYVRHASLRLDLEILLRTALTLLVGERPHEGAIRQAWEDGVPSIARSAPVPAEVASVVPLHRALHRRSA